MGITSDDFKDATGKPCRNCTRESFRLIEGLCQACYRQSEANLAEVRGEKVERRYFKRLFWLGKITVSELRDGRVPGECTKR